ncbi:type II toxin-antitoxin system HipA family toxin [Polaromonas naphthalenivorans]|uniref:HipA domain protein n=1 Tax=Polaromonas naphthalenivorans (strain CJ2) TaxID=365044 RepID=A1VVE2_POLNA|nr:HipA domain-containing protein [Polaromonas naphthalenivorans]ABM39620.1 HipA domain protein [Polaromonas naphthalenivorans CJ2]
MARQVRELYVFASIAKKAGPRFVPAGLLTLTEDLGAGARSRELASRFSYGTRYLQRLEAIEIDPVSLSIPDRKAAIGQEFFPANGLEEFGGIRDAAPDAWGRRVIEARRRVPANSLAEADYLLQAGGDRVGALDIRADSTSPDSPSASDMRSLGYVLQAADRVDQGLPVPASLEDYLGAGPSAGGARPKASVRDDDGALWLAKFPARGDTLDVARAESCTLELARRCGLTVPEVKYQDIGGRPVMLIRRFDRYWAAAGQAPAAGTALHDTRPDGGLMEGRLAFVSGLTLVGCSEFESRTKGYHDLAHAIRQFAHPQSIRKDCEELFTRMVFNIFVSNDDDHLRNHGFVHSPHLAGWVLSPLYDVVPRPSLAYERMLHLQVGTEGKLASLDNAMTHFAAFTPERSRALALIRQVWGEVRQWRTCFEEFAANGKLIDQIGSAFRDLEDIASPALVAQIRKPD